MFSFCILFTLIENYMQILGIPMEFFFPYLRAQCISTGQLTLLKKGRTILFFA